MNHEQILLLSKDAPWVKIAYDDYLRNVHRIPGGENHPRILEYWKHTNYNPKTDEESFCAAAMNCWLAESGYEGTNDPAARSFMDLSELKHFKPGCLAVFSRGNSNWQGHISIAMEYEEKNLTLLCLGANQGDDHKVCFKNYSDDRLLGFYWPKKLL